MTSPKHRVLTIQHLHQRSTVLEICHYRRNKHTIPVYFILNTYSMHAQFIFMDVNSQWSRIFNLLKFDHTDTEKKSCRQIMRLSSDERHRRWQKPGSGSDTVAGIAQPVHTGQTEFHHLHHLSSFFFTAPCFSNGAVMPSLGVRPSVCPSVCNVGEH